MVRAEGLAQVGANLWRWGEVKKAAGGCMSSTVLRLEQRVTRGEVRVQHSSAAGRGKGGVRVQHSSAVGGGEGNERQARRADRPVFLG